MIERLKKYLHEKNLRALIKKKGPLTDSQWGDLERMGRSYKHKYGRSFDA